MKAELAASKVLQEQTKAIYNVKQPCIATCPECFSQDIYQPVPSSSPRTKGQRVIRGPQVERPDGSGINVPTVEGRSTTISSLYYKPLFPLVQTTPGTSMGLNVQQIVSTGKVGRNTIRDRADRESRQLSRAGTCSVRQ